MHDVNGCPSKLHSVLSIPTASVAANVILMYGVGVVPLSATSLFLLSTASIISTSGAVVSSCDGAVHSTVSQSPVTTSPSAGL